MSFSDKCVKDCESIQSKNILPAGLRWTQTTLLVSHLFQRGQALAASLRLYITTDRAVYAGSLWKKMERR